MGNRANQKGLTLHNLDKVARIFPIASCITARPVLSAIRQSIDHFDKAVDMMQKHFPKNDLRICKPQKKAGGSKAFLQIPPPGGSSAQSTD